MKNLQYSAGNDIIDIDSEETQVAESLPEESEKYRGFYCQAFR